MSGNQTDDRTYGTITVRIGEPEQKKIAGEPEQIEFLMSLSSVISKLDVLVVDKSASVSLSKFVVCN